MPEIIQSVERVYDVIFRDKCNEHENICGCNTHKRTYDGYRITTDKQNIYIVIQNLQNCCEVWGYMSSDDDLGYYEQAELNGVSWTVNQQTKQFMLDTLFGDNGEDIDEGEAQFVDINTSRGVLTIALYNKHNGYYGHKFIIRSQTLDVIDML